MKKNEIKWAITSVILLVLVIVAQVVGYNKGQKDALLGQQKYKINILYQQQFVEETQYQTDTTYFFPYYIDGSFDVSVFGGDHIYKYDAKKKIVLHTYSCGTKLRGRYVPVDTILVKVKRQQ